MKIVEKKILPEYYQAVTDGLKKFELRIDEDDIQVGDILILREWSDGEYTDSEPLTRKVTYVLRDTEKYGLMKGFCIVSSEETKIQHKNSDNELQSFAEWLLMQDLNYASTVSVRTLAQWYVEDYKREKQNGAEE